MSSTVDAIRQGISLLRNIVWLFHRVSLSGKWKRVSFADLGDPNCSRRTLCIASHSSWPSALGRQRRLHSLLGCRQHRAELHCVRTASCGRPARGSISAQVSLLGSHDREETASSNVRKRPHLHCSGAVRYGQRLASAQHIVEETAGTPNPPETAAAGANDAARRLVAAHSDAILDMKVLQNSGGDRYLLSASADGIVKAWR